MFMGAPPRRLVWSSILFRSSREGGYAAPTYPAARSRIRLAAMTAGSQPSGRTSGLSTVLRVIVVWLLTAAALHLMSAILPGFVIEGEGSALLAAAADRPRQRAGLAAR